MMKRAFVIAGMCLGRALRLIVRHGFDLRYLLRVLFILHAGLWASLLAWRERRRLGPVLRRIAPPDDPLIIVSHWRTGTTLLHQLMVLDPALVCPDTFQVTLPDGFLVGRRYTRPVMRLVLRGQRPMDNVRMGVDEPMEEEYALFRMTGLSPMKRLLFPTSGRYFLLDDETFLPETPGEQARWEEALLRFVTKVQHGTGRRVALKNPFHGPRIPVLQRLFPRARFVHIERDPLVVIPSTVRLWSILGRLNTLRAAWRPPAFEEVVTVFERVTRRIEQDLAGLPAGQHARVRFGELERDPATALADLYRQLDLPFSDELARRVEAFGKLNATYVKNRYQLTAEQEALVRTRLGAFIRGGMEEA